MTEEFKENYRTKEQQRSWDEAESVLAEGAKERLGSCYNGTALATAGAGYEIGKMLGEEKTHMRFPWVSVIAGLILWGFFGFGVYCFIGGWNGFK